MINYKHLHNGFYRLLNIRKSDTLFMDVAILLDPKVSVETKGFSKLVSWSLNDYDLFIDFDLIGHLLTGFARITHY